jgi:hypothetical protein
MAIPFLRRPDQLQETDVVVHRRILGLAEPASEPLASEPLDGSRDVILTALDPASDENKALLDTDAKREKQR